MANVQDTVGLRLRYALDDIARMTGDNLVEISKKSRVPYRSLQDYLADKRVPGGEALKKFQEIGVDISWVLGGEGDLDTEDDYFEYKFAIRSAREKLDILVSNEMDKYFYFINKNKSYENRVQLWQIISMKEMNENIFWSNMSQKGTLSKYFQAYSSNNKQEMNAIFNKDADIIRRVVRRLIKIMVGESDLLHAEHEMEKCAMGMRQSSD